MKTHHFDIRSDENSQEWFPGLQEKPYFLTPQPPMLTTTKQYILPLSTFPYSKSKATHADTPHRKSSQTKSDESIGIGQIMRALTIGIGRINRKGSHQERGFS